jgi:putative transcriptional regulator
MQNRIKQFREDAGLAQSALAEAVGWKQSRWSNYERAERLPDVNDAREIVRAFQHMGITLTLDDLFPANIAAA